MVGSGHASASRVQAHCCFHTRLLLLKTESRCPQPLPPAACRTACMLTMLSDARDNTGGHARCCNCSNYGSIYGQAPDVTAVPHQLTANVTCTHARICWACLVRQQHPLYQLHRSLHGGKQAPAMAPLFLQKPTAHSRWPAPCSTRRSSKVCSNT